jgi:hypothetical protein
MAASCIALPVLAVIKSFGSNWSSAVVLLISGTAYGIITFAGLFAFGFGDLVPWREWLRRLKMS